MSDRTNSARKHFSYLHPSYLLSLPERIVRALAAGIGGLAFELTEVVLPKWLRRSRLYQSIVYRLLRITIELVGGVQGVFPSEKIAVGELATRKALGNVIELAGFVAFGWSPMWLLAAASDLTGGTRTFLNVLIAELQSQGVLAGDANIDSVDDLLNALETSSGMMADMVDVPPLKVQDLKNSLQVLKQNTKNLPSSADLAGVYKQMQLVAGLEKRSVGELSALMTIGAARAGFRIGSTYIFDYYYEALNSIRAEGWGTYAGRIARPYAMMTLRHFSPSQPTYTQKVMSLLRNKKIKSPNT
jgi:hypothetical protein